jgi:RecQ family ATP-dependent DNA helicase
LTYKPRKILAEVFGFSDYKPGQKEIIEAVLDGRNVLAVLPTGGGKSLCYQLPALCFDGLVVVVSPLIALMRDQVQYLQDRGVAAGSLNSSNSDDENERTYRSVLAGKAKLLFISPERLASFSQQRMLRQVGVSMFAIDEAHCVSQWGHEFRPDYLDVGKIARQLCNQIVAFTATADQRTRDNICISLFGEGDSQSFVGGFDRPNIALSFQLKDKPRKQVHDFVTANANQCGIIYTASRSKADALARSLSADGHNAVGYHAGMDRDLRKEVEKRFRSERDIIVVATIAFGMGIDRADVAWVLHADLPKSVENYYQEVGRAGRNWTPAQAHCLFSADDLRYRKSQIDESVGEDRYKKADHARLDTMVAIATTTECRRVALLEYFGEAAKPCGNCDTCARQPGHTVDPKGSHQALSRQSNQPSIAELVPSQDQELFAQLKGRRRKIADAAKIAPYYVFSDKVLAQMASDRPISIDELAKIRRIGPKKIEWYGASFLEVTTGALQQPVHPKRRKLAGSSAALIYDALVVAQLELQRGQTGTEKSMRCSASVLARVASSPAEAKNLQHILGARSFERFGDEFLRILRDY